MANFSLLDTILLRCRTPAPLAEMHFHLEQAVSKHKDDPGKQQPTPG
jgi:hypothetical protein